MAAAAAATVIAARPHTPSPAQTSADPRLAPPVILVAVAQPASPAARSFTGTVAARIQTELGFRVPGKIMLRLADTGQTVRQGDRLAVLDGRDLGLALVARRNAAASARATVVQAAADEARYRELSAQGWVSRQKYEAARASLQTASAALAAAEAQAEVAGNEADYTTLRADADGVVAQVLAELGAVVAAGQPVIRLAHAGPREAVVNLPEGVRPPLGTQAQVTVYRGSTGAAAVPAELRQLSDAADPATRTYEARFVLGGDAAQAPLGSTVTLRLAAGAPDAATTIPLSALHDDGRATGVWVVDPSTAQVHFRPVRVRLLGAEQAEVEGIAAGEQVAALGTPLLREGQAVRVTAAEQLQ